MLKGILEKVMEPMERDDSTGGMLRRHSYGCCNLCWIQTVWSTQKASSLTEFREVH